MSVEPVTVTVTLKGAEFGADTDALARAKAAEELGLDPDQVMCVSRGRAEYTSERFSEADEGGDRERIADAMLTIESTWAPAFVAQRRTVTPVAWSDIKLGRGSRWNGMIPDPNDHSKAIEATLISDGEKLIHMDSPEGMAILRELGQKFDTGGERVG